MAKYKKSTVIVEIGCNHKGDTGIAKEMIKMAAIFCKVDVVKFQKRTPRELLTEEQYNAPHPNPYNAYGATYGQHREFLEFNLDQHRELKHYCEEFGLKYSCSVWDLTSAKEIASLDPEFIKIPSAMNTHIKLLDWLCQNYSGKLHISTGMTTKDEVEGFVNYFEEKGRVQDIVLYACTSGYPVAFNEVCLLEISGLKEKYGGKIAGIGFSGHHLGIAVDVAAYTLGAEWIERHYTLDRTWKGTDHAASLEPDGMRKLVRNLNATYQALHYKNQQILPGEEEQRNKLKYKER